MNISVKAILKYQRIYSKRINPSKYGLKLGLVWNECEVEKKTIKIVEAQKQNDRIFYRDEEGVFWTSFEKINLVE